MEYTNQVMKELGMCKTGIFPDFHQVTLYPDTSDPHVKLHVPVKSNEDVAFLIKQEDKSWKAYTLPSDGNEVFGKCDQTTLSVKCIDREQNTFGW